jgi:hypothetical protein
MFMESIFKWKRNNKAKISSGPYNNKKNNRIKNSYKMVLLTWRKTKDAFISNNNRKLDRGKLRISNNNYSITFKPWPRNSCKIFCGMIEIQWIIKTSSSANSKISSMMKALIYKKRSSMNINYRRYSEINLKLSVKQKTSTCNSIRKKLNKGQ